MKILAMIPLFLLSPNANAQSEAPRVHGKSHKCSELQALVERHGKLIVTGWLGGEQLFVSGDDQCSPNTELVLPGYDQSRDKNFCLIGYLCEGDINAD